MSIEHKSALGELKNRLEKMRKGSADILKAASIPSTSKKSGLDSASPLVNSGMKKGGIPSARLSKRGYGTVSLKEMEVSGPQAFTSVPGNVPSLPKVVEKKSAPHAKIEQTSLASLKASSLKDLHSSVTLENKQLSKRTQSIAADAPPKTDKKGEPDVSVNPNFELGLRYRMPKKLSNLPPEKLHKLAAYITNQIYISKADRNRFIDNLLSYRSKWMDFETTGLQITDLGEHDEHIPLVFEKGKAMYARLVNAILGVDPMFSLTPNKSVSEKQKQEKEDLLHWVTNQYANRSRGLKEDIDKDCWNFVLDGTSITKHWWARDIRKFVDVEEKEIRPIQIDEHGNPVTEVKEVERETIVYDGPMMQSLPLEDVYIIGSNCDDIDNADLVIHRQYMTKSDIIKLSNQGFFSEEAVSKVIAHAPANPGKGASDEEANLKLQKDQLSGIERTRYEEGRAYYTIYETYLSYDIDNDGIDEELVCWMEPETRKILRITYLDRVSPNGKRPFVLKKLIHREGKPYGIGFAEMLWGLQNTTDYIANQRLDAGLFQIFPWFVFRAGSNLQVGPQTIGPGKGIPVDDVNDISFPRVNGNPAYGFQEESSVMQHAERITGLNDLAMGQSNSQGVGRTATGASALVNELNANLDIYIKHYQWGFSRNLKFLDKQVQELLPLGLEYRVVGMDGRAMYKRFSDRDVFNFDCDFEITGNTVNSNKAIERDTSQMLLQVLQNPIALQAGIVNPLNLYNVYKNLLRKFEIRDIDSYLTRPEAVEGSPYTALDEINMILAGVLPQIFMNDKHQEKLSVFEAFEKSPEFAYYTEGHLPLYMETKRAHEQYASAISAQAPALNQAGGAGVAPMLQAQIAAGSGNPSGEVPNQMSDLAPMNSMAKPEGEMVR